jgi:hypothetical protein
MARAYFLVRISEPPFAPAAPAAGAYALAGTRIFAAVVAGANTVLLRELASSQRILLVLSPVSGEIPGGTGAAITALAQSVSRLETKLDTFIADARRRSVFCFSKRPGVRDPR